MTALSSGGEHKPYVWQMIRQAIEVLGPETTNGAMREWILERWPNTKQNTISCQIIVCTVNHASRIHYPENHKPRRAQSDYDFLYRPERGKLEFYDPTRHGLWEIFLREDGRPAIRQVNEEEVPVPEAVDLPSDGAFAAEDHLRDFLARPQNLEAIEPELSLFVDDDGNDGVEYVTPVGRIDILAEDGNGGLVVIELKVGRGPDSVVGQILRYKGWVKRHLADGRPVRGIIIAQHISDRVRYAVAEVEGIELKEYSLSINVTSVCGLGEQS